MRRIIYFFTIYCLILFSLKSQAYSVSSDSLKTKTSDEIVHLPNDVMPVIGAWWWGENEFKPEGYKVFLDQVNINSCYNLLSTAIRVPGRTITDIDVHNQVKQAVEYANKLGIQIGLELDIRSTRRKFEAMYPDELQEAVILQELKLSANDPVVCVVQSNKGLTDHMTGRKENYIPLRGSLLRVYSYDKTKNGIDPNTLKDITTECTVTVSSKDSVVVRIPPNAKNTQLQACVMVLFTHLCADVFSPHIMDFESSIIRSYSDVPLAGGMRDEWGFPPSSPQGKDPLQNQFWYSKYYASEYAKKNKWQGIIIRFIADACWNKRKGE